MLVRVQRGKTNIFTVRAQEKRGFNQIKKSGGKLASYFLFCLALTLYESFKNKTTAGVSDFLATDELILRIEFEQTHALKTCTEICFIVF